MTSRQTFHVSRANSEASRLEAYRLRYRVVCEERGDYRHADHAGKIFRDPIDGDQTSLFVAEDAEGKIVGTLRLTLRRDQAFIAELAHAFPILARVLGMTCAEMYRQVGFIERGVVSKAFRGSGVFTELLIACESEAVRSNQVALVAIVDVRNIGMIKLLMRHGWNTYPVTSTRRGWRGQHLYKDIRTASAIRREADPEACG